MTSVDYSGRNVDLLIFQGAQPAGEQQLTLAFGDGLVITGIQVLCQRFVHAFLTRVGTNVYRPTFGTDFVTAVMRGSIRDEADVKAAFTFAAQAVRQILLLDAVSNPPPVDELFQSATLQSFILDKAKGVLSLKIAISSAAGISRVVFLPVPIAIR